MTDHQRSSIILFALSVTVFAALLLLRRYHSHVLGMQLSWLAPLPALMLVVGIIVFCKHSIQNRELSIIVCLIIFAVVATVLTLGRTPPVRGRIGTKAALTLEAIGSASCVACVIIMLLVTWSRSRFLWARDLRKVLLPCLAASVLISTRSILYFYIVSSNPEVSRFGVSSSTSLVASIYLIVRENSVFSELCAIILLFMALLLYYHTCRCHSDIGCKYCGYPCTSKVCSECGRRQDR
jgi:hypothetical protein